jgi:hypothetical protein
MAEEERERIVKRANDGRRVETAARRVCRTKIS